MTYEKLLEIRSQQTLIAFSTICCFSESVLSSNDSLIKDFLTFICMIKWKSAFLKANSVYTRIMKDYNVLFKKALFANLRAAC